MADRDRRFPENVDGVYFVDGSCIDCDLCRITAPHSFAANEDERHSYVYRQPVGEEERALCEEAREHCPVDAIGCDAAS